MRARLVQGLLGVISLTLLSHAQSIQPVGGPMGALLGSVSSSQDGGPDQQNPGSLPVNVVRLSVKDAEALALKNNPAISVARLNALASQQVIREARSSLWPQATANLTAVDARDNSRITAGALNNPIIYTRAAEGMTVSQLITDFGHTTNLVASARLQARAEEQNSLATKEDVLVAVDQAFYNAQQTHA
ncbi:MAG TPA: TolC family protein, partial [Dongiaceae bacterium]|nr:TolC family protein [Dongiaceae bacterium]